MRWRLVCLLTIPFAARLQAAEDVDYERDIKPLFAQKCGVCHGALKQQGGLRLDAGTLVLQGGDGGYVVKPGSADDSLLLQRVTAEDPDQRMPPQGEGSPLTAEQVALLSAWIEAGAAVPASEVIPSDPRQHWAYRLPSRPAPPDVGDARWSHPIDSFIAREHQQIGLTPVETAHSYTLLRRVYMDLIGLPPTRQQIEGFVSDNSPQAWENVVDGLLDSPHYGERWGRHWMDVWRYSDWDGYKQELRGSQRHIWRWRDWIVRSLNEDKGYDRMIVEMLAGDEVAPNDPEVLPATGFLARNYHKSNRNIWLDATVEHTAKAFLGMTLDCARCHDHKYDPLSQTAYYQFRAIFEPHSVRTDVVPGQLDLMKDGLPRVFDDKLDAKTFLFVAGNEKHFDKYNPVQPAVPSFIGGRFDIRSVALPLEAYYPALREPVVNQQIAAAQEQVESANRSLADARAKPEEDSTIETLELKHSIAQLRAKSLQARYAADVAKFTPRSVGSLRAVLPAGSEYDESTWEGNGTLAKELAVSAAECERRLAALQAALTVRQKKTALADAERSSETDEQKRQAAIAQANKELAAAEKDLQAAENALDKSDRNYTPLGTEYSRTSSGRRSALARWIAAEDNPLTARVAVNHIWMRHFGSPLVDHVFDFGLRSEKPPHAELLDWLAVEFMENDWSMKHLHRLIVTSRTWQLASSGANNPSDKIDPDNQYLWRSNIRRLEAETVRDSLLAVSGQLDRTLGGADIDFRQGETCRRRSIYLRHAYEKQMTMLVLFDAANPTDCYRRSESIVPQQALALTNSALALSQSRLLAARLWSEVALNDAEDRFIELAFMRTLTRTPNDEERRACAQFLVDQTRTLSAPETLTTFLGGSEPKVKPATDPAQRARENLVHVLMNHNDFVTIR